MGDPSISACTMRSVDRRHFVRGTGAAIVTGVLAGCTGGGDGDGGGETTPPQQIDDYLSGANNYGGTISDQTGKSEVTIDVGAGNGLSFGPAAVRIGTGTTVVWEWTGQGGSHNVVAAEDSDSQFRSGDPTAESGHTFEKSFDDAGIQLYYCNPHRAQGMLGAIEVVKG